MSYKDPDKQREYQRRWIAERRNNFFANKRCSNCGSTSRLELHHLDPSVKISHNIWSWAEDKRNAEIQKCIIVCKDCHEAAHKNEKRKATSNVIHGTSNTYKTAVAVFYVERLR